MVYTIKELDEHLRSVSSITSWVMSASFAKHVTERNPILLDQNLEAFKRSEVRIEHKLGQWTKLSCSVPAIRAVNQDVLLASMNGLKDLVCARE